MGGGFVKQGWVHNNENIGGELVSSDIGSGDVHPPCGAFVYQIIANALDAKVPRVCFYSVVPASGDLFHRAQKRLGALTDRGETHATPSLSDVRKEMYQRCKAIALHGGAARDVHQIEEADQDQLTLGNCAEMCVRRAVMCAVFGLFLGLGVLFYTQYPKMTTADTEHMQVDAIEALYFSITTISTVGYGDYSPDGNYERLFTVFYQLVGIAMIFGIAAELYTGSTAFFLVRINKMVRWVSSKCYPISKGKNMPAWLYYTTGLAGPIIFGVMGTQVCGEDLDFKKHVLPLVQRFRQLDVDGGGQLDHEDLVFMVETAQEHQCSKLR